MITEVARTEAVAAVDTGDEALAELEATVGFDDDLAAEVTQRDHVHAWLLTQFHPALERAIGSRLHHAAILELTAPLGRPERTT